MVIGSGLVRVVLVVALMAGGVGVAWGEVPYRFNVRDYGAKGDGVTDDTAAVQAAMYAAGQQGERSVQGLFPNGIWDRPPIMGVGERTEVPAVFFPAGRYRLTRTVVVDSSSVTLGEPGAVVVMEDPTQDIFYVHWAFRVLLQGLTFEGGKNQFLVSTGNNESARIVIRDCHFIGASAAGIDCNSHLRPEGTDYATRPLLSYDVTWQDGVPTLTPNDLTGKDMFNNSTLFSCTNSTFRDCVAALNVGADGVVVRDCTVEARADEPGSVFHFGKPYHGHAYLVNVKATMPAGATLPPDRAWIDNNAHHLFVRNSDFQGGPLPLIRQLMPQGGAHNVPSIVVVTDTQVQVGGAERSHVLWIDNRAQENTPYLIEISRVTDVSAKGDGRALGWSVHPNRRRLQEAVHVDQPALDAYKAALIRWPYRVLIHDNVQLADGVPSSLQPSRSTPEPAALRESLWVAPATMTRPEPAQTLFASAYGVVGQDGVNDTEAMQRVLSAAAALPGITRIVLPASRVAIRDSLELPPRVILTAPGQGWIDQHTPDRPIFKGEGTEYLRVERMTFTGGGIGFDLNTVPTAEIEFDICGFYSMSFAGIRLRSGEANQSRFRLRDSTFMTVKRVLDSDSTQAEIDSIWTTGHGHMDDIAAVINRPGGRMLVRHWLTVPGLMRIHWPEHLPWVKDWPYGDNIRWLDNYGQMALQDNRFGGEWMGIGLVYNRDPRATLMLDGGLSCFMSEWVRRYMVYNEYAPASVLVKNVGWAMVFPNSGVWKTVSHQPQTDENIVVTNVVYGHELP